MEYGGNLPPANTSAYLIAYIIVNNIFFQIFDREWKSAHFEEKGEQDNGAWRLVQAWQTG